MIRFVLRCVGGGLIFVGFFGMAIGTTSPIVIPILLSAGILLIATSADKSGY